MTAPANLPPWVRVVREPGVAEVPSPSEREELFDEVRGAADVRQARRMAAESYYDRANTIQHDEDTVDNLVRSVIDAVLKAGYSKRSSPSSESDRAAVARVLIKFSGESVHEIAAILCDGEGFSRPASPSSAGQEGREATLKLLTRCRNVVDSMEPEGWRTLLAEIDRVFTLIALSAGETETI